MTCTDCPLHLVNDHVCVPRHRESTAGGVLFVTADPVDVKSMSYRILSRACEEYGITNWSISSIVKCRVPGTRAPYVKEVSACDKHFQADVRDAAPAWVVPLGNAPLLKLTGFKGITKFAGREWVPEEGDLPPYRVFPMLDPGIVVHDAAQLEKVDLGFEAFVRASQGIRTQVAYPWKAAPCAAEALEALAAEAAQGPVRFAIDLETTDLNPRYGRIRTFAIATGPFDAWWAEWHESLAEPLYKLLTSGATMLAHNASFEIKWLYQYVVKGVVGRNWRETTWPVLDSLLLHHLIDENADHRLTILSKKDTDIGGYDDAVEDLKARGVSFEDMDVEVLGPYNAGDADACYRLATLYYGQIRHDGRAELYSDIIEPSIFTAAQAELEGWYLDRDRLVALRAELQEEEEAALRRLLSHPQVVSYMKESALDAERAWAKLTDLRAEANAASGPEKGELRERVNQFMKDMPKPLAAWGEYPEGTFNPNSTAQLRAILFDRLGVPVEAFTKSGLRATAEKHLKAYADTFPFVATYLEWKKANTLRQRYLDRRIIPYLDPRTGYVYPSFKLHGTVSGRWSSNNPNIQNQAPRIKPIFISRFSGGSIVEVDFAQLELRLIAWASGCRALLDVFRQGRDPHTETATRVLGFVPETDQQRKEYGKEPNFGFTYGAGPARFAAEMSITQEKAQMLYDRFHKAYPEIGKYAARVQQSISNTGVVKGFLNRIRHITDYNAEDWKVRNHALLSGSNFPIQNLGAELTIWAFSRIAREVAQRGLRSLPVATVHDSVLFDCPADEVETVSRIAVEIMTTRLREEFPELGVPLEAEAKAGPSWGELYPVNISPARSVEE